MIVYYTYDEMRRFFKKDMEKNEAVYQLILGNMNYVRKQVEAGESIDANTKFGAIFDGDIPVYYFNNLLPYSMVVMPADPSSPKEPIRFGKELAKEFTANGITINGIQSVKELTEAFVAEYTKKELELSLSMDIMVTDSVVDFPLVGEVVRASIDDLDEVCELYLHFCEDALGESPSMEEIRERKKNQLVLPNVYIWLYRINGKTVGMNMSTRQLEHGASINGVYIKPEERKKGYCKQMMSYASKYYLDHGFDYVTLYVDKTNPFSNAAYTSVGYKYICSVYSYEEKRR